MSDEIVLFVGYPASGKSSLAKSYEKTHVRLNRDLLGGTLAKVAEKLNQAVRRGGRRFVLDGDIHWEGWVLDRRRGAVIGVGNSMHNMETASMLILNAE